MGTYRNINNGIWIPAIPSSIIFYETSKNIIKENSLVIEENIQALAKIKSKLEEVMTSENESNKKDRIELLNDFIKFKYLYCFFLHFTMDFSINIRELMLAPTKSEQLFYTKVIYIDLYRYLERHNADLGIIKKLSLSSDEYKEYHKSYMRFRDSHYQEIKDNRNLFYAHFDAKFQYDKYYNIEENIDANIVGKMCISFNEAHLRLSSIYVSIDNDFHKKTEGLFN